MASPMGGTAAPTLGDQEFETSAVAASRTQTITVTGQGTVAKIVTFPADADVGNVGLVGTVSAAATTASVINRGAGTAAQFMAQIVIWLNTGTNLAKVGLTAIHDNTDGTALITYIAGADANDITPTSDQTGLSFAQITPGSDATGRFALPETTQLGTEVKDNGFFYKLIDPTLIAVESGWVVMPKRYAALLSQTGTDNPTVGTLYENTLGATVTWTYSGTGIYHGTTSSAVLTVNTVPFDRTILNVNNGSLNGLTGVAVGGSTFEVKTCAAADLTNGADDLLASTYIEILVYP